MDEQLQKYNKNDFLNSTAPFEYVYQFAGDKFQLLGILEQMSEAAKDVGVKNFKTRFKAYCDLQKKNTSVVYANSTTNFDGQPLELDAGEWTCDDAGVTTFNGFGMEIIACVHPIMPVLRLVNIDTGIEKLKIAYKKGRGWRSVIADKKTLASANSIIDLANCGIAVNSENSKYLVKYLHDIENLNYEAIPQMNSVSRLGWIDGEGFAPYVDELVFDGDANFKTFFDSVHECGDYAKWLELARTVRANGIYGRIILAASFASALVGPLQCLPFFVHLWGETETGKTVALMLACSVWANPEPGRFVHTFNSTAVGREKSASFVNSLPLILDELQISNDKKQFDKDIYMLSEGAGRTRGTKTGGIDKTGTWANCILTSGEQPITNNTSGGGAVNRIIEVECKDKIFEDARAVADAARNNYGFAGRIFTEKLQEDNNIANVSQLFNAYKNAFEKADTTEKQVMAISLILTADHLATMWIFQDGKELSVEDMPDFIRSKDSVSVNARAYEYVCEYVVANKNKFQGYSDINEVWGAIDERFMYIIRSQFNKICEDAGYNQQSLLSWLKQNRKIEFSGRAFTKTKRVNGEAVQCVWLRKQDNPFEDLPDDEQIPF